MTLQADIFRTRVNTIVGILFVGSFAFGAGLIIWHAAFGVNPVENVLYASLIEEGAIASTTSL